MWGLRNGAVGTVVFRVCLVRIRGWGIWGSRPRENKVFLIQECSKQHEHWPFAPNITSELRTLNSQLDKTEGLEGLA